MITKIEPHLEIPFNAWLYCEIFGWACQNKSHTLTAEIRIRQGFTHYSDTVEKPSSKP